MLKSDESFIMFALLVASFWSEYSLEPFDVGEEHEKR